MHDTLVPKLREAHIYMYCIVSRHYDICLSILVTHPCQVSFASLKLKLYMPMFMIIRDIRVCVDSVYNELAANV